MESGDCGPGPERIAEGNSFQKLQDSVTTLQEENDRMRREIERGGGDLWTKDDRPKDIARLMIGKLGKSKAAKLADEIRKALKAASVAE